MTKLYSLLLILNIKIRILYIARNFYFKKQIFQNKFSCPCSSSNDSQLFWGQSFEVEVDSLFLMLHFFLFLWRGRPHDWVCYVYLHVHCEKNPYLITIQSSVSDSYIDLTEVFKSTCDIYLFQPVRSLCRLVRKWSSWLGYQYFVINQAAAKTVPLLYG